MTKNIGILTSGGDCPGINAALRAVGKAGFEMGMRFIGFKDGFRGLVLDNTIKLNDRLLSGIIAVGGTFLGTSRDKPHRMTIKGVTRDMTDEAVKIYRRHQLDALVCLGGGGTQKNALHLKKAGLNIITLPKTIDNDVPETDVSFGFDTALEIVTDAIDKLHSTAMSHGRIIVVEVMGHRAGWLALGAGIAGGADVILIPEIPYDVNLITKAIRRRSKIGKNFSIIVVAEGAMSKREADMIKTLVAAKNEARGKLKKKKASDALAAFHRQHINHTLELTKQLEKMVGLESRLSILGHLQRGGSPSAGDRILATRLGSACAEFLNHEKFGIMVALKGDGIKAVPLELVAGKKKFVPLDHPWIHSACSVETCLGI
ncbi:MAG TPA: ATP-dependent 6-phosphofructokinase [Smithella sp.]|nr:ATP-dependent 6-phosphofructokinase [Smithella sp.]